MSRAIGLVLTRLTRCDKEPHVLSNSRRSQILNLPVKLLTTIRKHTTLAVAALLVIGLLAVIALAAPLLRNARTGAALAYSYENGAYSSQDQAINAAVDKCVRRGCKAVVWFHNGCGAFAKGSGGSYGWGIGDDRAEAASKALAECRKRGEGCRNVEWARSRGR